MKPQELLQVGPRPGERLRAALLTTFEPADRAILADRLLPSLLGLPPAPAADSQEFARANAVMCTALETLRGKIVIVSSSGNDAGKSWLSSYIRFRTTASTQHAKLWLLHWGKESGRDRLELVVSSANLTSGGIDGQIQAAWRASVILEEAAHGSESWGDLLVFLHRLNRSAGPSNDLQQFLELLKRARCPDGVHFVATVPGDGKTCGTASLGRGIAALGMRPKLIRILTPFIGSWDSHALKKWVSQAAGSCAAEVRLAAARSAGSSPEKLHWKLGTATRDALWSARHGMDGLAICFGLLTGETDTMMRGGASTVADPRWMHGKLYEFSSSRSSALLVTSANFTPTAWAGSGRGNFELGVLLKGASMPLPLAPATARADILTSDQPRADGAGLWGSAEWDGTQITVTLIANSGVHAKIASKGSKRKSEQDGYLTIKVAHSTRPPATVQIMRGTRSMLIPVLDIRTGPLDLPLGELKEDEWQRWRDQLLLETYGRSADAGLGTPKKRNGSKPKMDSDYSVDALEEGRQYFSYIDSWQAKFDLKKSKNQAAADAPKLLALLVRHCSASGAAKNIVGAARDEFALRLKMAGISHG